jgi:malate synthase
MEINKMLAGDSLNSEFLAFYMPLHEKYTPWQQALNERRKQEVGKAYMNSIKPDYGSRVSEEKPDEWKIDLPEWCQDQRNQMTGPADNAELVVKMMNSGAPGVMIDFEDSMANQWPNLMKAHTNALNAIYRTISYHKKNKTNLINEDSKSVMWIRPRGLHMTQNLGFPYSLSRAETSASLFDVARIAFYVNSIDDPKFAPEGLKNQPLTFYIPKSESAAEAKWWASLFKDIAQAKGWEPDYIKCMALLESHPLAYQAEDFIWNLKDHIVGLNLGRWDYMASLIEYNQSDPQWVLPDRNTIPHDISFFQDLRKHMVNVCHFHGIMAIGGMTALYPSRTDSELNERALKILEADKKNEAAMGMDGAWTGHPDQNQIAVDQFPEPNQIGFVHANPNTFEWDRQPDLRPTHDLGGGTISENGTRQAIRVAIRYRNGVLIGKGASLLDGYMEDLATDRICRLMISQRLRHLKDHTGDYVRNLFNEELQRLIDDGNEQGTEETLRKAKVLTESYVMLRQHNPS